jgi:hypothetical protein
MHFTTCEKAGRSRPPYRARSKGKSGNSMLPILIICLNFVQNYAFLIKGWNSNDERLILTH